MTRVRPLSFRRDSFSRSIHYDGFDVPSYGIRRYAGLDGLYDFRNGSTLRLKADYFDEDTSMRFSDASMDASGIHVVLQQDEKSRTERTQWDTSLTYEGKTAGNAYSGEAYYSRLKKYSETWNGRPDFKDQIHSPYVPSALTSLTSRLDNLFKARDYDRAFYEIWGISGKDTITRRSHSFT
uniref:hypothetical protein n=1 Tax=Dialister succinatiphilus TaxID=487173 RepID=UPI0040389B53